jgi:hypothetical protein
MLANVKQAFQPVFEPVHRLESLCHFPPHVGRFVFLIVSIGEPLLTNYRLIPSFGIIWPNGVVEALVPGACRIQQAVGTTPSTPSSHLEEVVTTSFLGQQDV